MKTAKERYLNLSKKEVDLIIERYRNNEAIVDIADEYKVCPQTIRSSIYRHYPDFVLTSKVVTKKHLSKLIKMWDSGHYTGGQINRKVPYLKFVELKRVFDLQGIEIHQYKKKNGIKVSDLEYEIIEEYMNTNTTHSALSKKYGITNYKLNALLKDVTPYRDSLPYLNMIYDKLAELRQLKRVCEDLKITDEYLRSKLNLLGKDYTHLLDKKRQDYKYKEYKDQIVNLYTNTAYKRNELADKFGVSKLYVDAILKGVKKLYKAPKDPKPNKEVKKQLPKVKKSKTNTKIGKKVDDLRMFKAAEMQKGEVKVPKNKKVFETLPKEKHNAGYLLRIDDKTSIFVKDGASPEVAIPRYHERMAKKKD